jgi:hypothetical protein
MTDNKTFKENVCQFCMNYNDCKNSNCWEEQIKICMDSMEETGKKEW